MLYLMLDQSEFQDMYDHAQRTSAIARGFIPPHVWLAYKQAQRKKDNPEQ